MFHNESLDLLSNTKQSHEQMHAFSPKFAILKIILIT